MPNAANGGFEPKAAAAFVTANARSLSFIALGQPEHLNRLSNTLE